ncbi:polar amino acid ABC transporter permease [candidate division KSB3 bacterium]|uniref:Polar amino acid ABC transporter permease n=1 Tax=candidate division KSB3 bacterium TaxID=2044937 RepID=A0A2G6KLM3_9BACT|nr:MAG: polar amino acid ABC transporter permease [candidate division KSB3 bacterium]
MKFSKKLFLILDVFKFLGIVGLVIWFLARGTEKLGYHWQWYRVPRYLFTFKAGKFAAGPLLDGLGLTFKIAGVSLGLALAIGLITALFRLSHSFTARALAHGYLEVIRNTPLLIQLFFIYFVMAPVIDMDAFSSAVLALSLFEGAYASEILRAGIVSIHKGQWEAAYSLGISSYHSYRYVILPQAFQRILPPLTSQGVSLIKDSALVSTIAIYDLTMQGQAIIAETFLTFEIWFTVAAIYLVITVSLSLLVQLMEKKMSNPV